MIPAVPGNTMTDVTDAVEIPDWRRAFGAPSVSGDFRSVNRDFQVTEALGFELDDSGEHDWLWIEKSDVNTPWLARQLARYATVPANDVGFAGMKDRHAVTRQWFSVRRPAGARADWRALDLPGVTVLEQRRHSRKLRRGAHRANHFEIRLRHLDGDPCERLERIAAAGIPNYFGEQRFGHGGHNLALARSLFSGRRLRRDKRSIALSAARGYLFNVVLDARIGAGTWDRLLPGDVASLEGSNSVFDVDEVTADIEGRAACLDLHPSGPLWGRSRGKTGARLLEPERHQAADHEALRDGLERHCEAGRRALRAVVQDLHWELSDRDLVLSFTLGRGIYATALLRELAHLRHNVLSST